ncbi:MAG: hypothetical protein KC589_07090 [Nanoarchaeota archaeon]|nr:hypothetical protein [Nanoarchaeota archaeon]
MKYKVFQENTPADSNHFDFGLKSTQNFETSIFDDYEKANEYVYRWILLQKGLKTKDTVIKQLSEDFSLEVNKEYNMSHHFNFLTYPFMMKIVEINS